MRRDGSVEWQNGQRRFILQLVVGSLAVVELDSDVIHPLERGGVRLSHQRQQLSDQGVTLHLDSADATMNRLVHIQPILDQRRSR